MKSRDNVKSKHKISRIASLLALLSFIPYLGFLIAPIIILWGLIKGHKSGQILATIGFVGLFCSWGITSHMSHLARAQHDNLHQDKYLRHIMPDLVQSIEYSKQYEGSYPASLGIFQGQDSDVHLSNETLSRLYYEITEEGRDYELLGIGADNKPFSADDILPTAKLSRTQ